MSRIHPKYKLTKHGVLLRIVARGLDAQQGAKVVVVDALLKRHDPRAPLCLCRIALEVRQLLQLVDAQFGKFLSELLINHFVNATDIGQRFGVIVFTV